jgi:hypothetical protein
MIDPEPTPSARLSELTRLARARVKPPSAAELSEGLQAVRARAAANCAGLRRVRGLTLLAGTLLASLALTAVLVSRQRGDSSVVRGTVSVARVAGGEVLAGGYLSEVGGGGVRLYFSEGSRFELTPGTRGRLRAVTAEGACLVLDRGTASFRITPNPNRRWSVEAGPFVISVRGTDFTVVWQPTSEKLEVQLRAGRVAVSGPIVGDELVLRPGQDLSISLPERKTVISEARSTAASAESSSPLTASSAAASGSAVAPADQAAPAGSRETAAARPDRRWREALAKGEWDIILADAEREGVAMSLKTRSSDELLALADAARYRHRPDLARSALLAERARFPSSPRALDALFLLGRVEEQRSGGKPSALTWYDAYLARAPAGTYAAEALGRKLMLVKETEGPASARRIAAEYLLRFPDGSYTAAARTLQQSR